MTIYIPNSNFISRTNPANQAMMRYHQYDNYSNIYWVGNMYTFQFNDEITHEMLSNLNM